MIAQITSDFGRRGEGRGEKCVAPNPFLFHQNLDRHNLNFEWEGGLVDGVALTRVCLRVSEENMLACMERETG